MTIRPDTLFQAFDLGRILKFPTCFGPGSPNEAAADLSLDFVQPVLLLGQNSVILDQQFVFTLTFCLENNSLNSSSLSTLSVQNATQHWSATAAQNIM